MAIAVTIFIMFFYAMFFGVAALVEGFPFRRVDWGHLFLLTLEFALLTFGLWHFVGAVATEVEQRQLSNIFLAPIILLFLVVGALARRWWVKHRFHPKARGIVTSIKLAALIIMVVSINYQSLLPPVVMRPFGLIVAGLIYTLWFSRYKMPKDMA